MVDKKTPEEIASMAQGGKILSDTMKILLSHAKPGVSELVLDQMAEELIQKKGGEPGFQKVKGYRHTICSSTNDVVVHGVPSSYTLKQGDIFGIDCGVYYHGFHTDMSETLRVSAKNAKRKTQNTDEIDTFLEAGKKALEEAIKVAQPGNRIGHISKTIQDIIEGGGYSAVRSLVGHGVGKQLHEEPEVPGYLTGSIEDTLLLEEGMVLAIEVIYNMGKPDVSYANDDGWTIKTADGSVSGVFEKTVAITKNGPKVLT